MGGTRVELVTSSMSTRRSTTELTAHTRRYSVEVDLYSICTKKQVQRYKFYSWKIKIEFGILTPSQRMDMMKNNLKMSLVIIGAIILAACSSGIKNNVTRFHKLPPPSGQTIEVIAMDPTLQQSIEFASYAQMIGHKLGTVGYNPPTGNATHYVAEIGYRIVPLQDAIVENRSPVSVGVGMGSGGRRSGTSVGVGISTSFGSSNNTAQYISALSMNIIDLSTGERLYEGHVESINRNQNLAQIMPIMIEALFQDFPGENGSSNTVKINPDK